MEEIKQSRVTWNCERVIRATALLRKIKLKDPTKRSELMERSLGVGLLVMRTLPESSVMVAGVLAHTVNYSEFWKKKAFEYFGKDVADVLQEVVNFNTFLENEQYDKLNQKIGPKTIVLSMAIENLIRTLTDKNISFEDKIYECSLVKWRMSYLEWTNGELQQSCENVIKNFERNEQIILGD